MSSQHAADALCWFGASGDLARKMTFPALYAMARRGRLTFPVIGVAHSDWTLDDLTDRARQSIVDHGGIDDPAAFDHLVGSLRYVDGDYSDPSTFTRLRHELDGVGSRHPAHYLAVPPVLFAEVVQGLGASGCAEGGRVVVEKPFGRDLASAQELNRVIHEVFDESAVYRIDHYLGKQEVLNLVYLRFANSLFEPVWNRDHIASVQVTMAEDFGVQGRGSFYDSVGALRDVVQNHLFQVVALLAMEPPVGGGMEALRDEKERVFRAMDRVCPADVVRGQFDGYLDEPGVAANSDVETFAAVRLNIDSWRWAGVPWLLRAGKQLPEHVTEVLIEFRKPPHKVFTEPQLATDGPNYLRFRLSPSPVIAMGVRSLAPGDHMHGAMSELVLCDDVVDERLPYERLLGEAMTGDPFMFAREDGVEAAWAVVDGVLDAPVAVTPYMAGTWGPAGADALLPHGQHWHQPVSPLP